MFSIGEYCHAGKLPEVGDRAGRLSAARRWHIMSDHITSDADTPSPDNTGVVTSDDNSAALAVVGADAHSAAASILGYAYQVKSGLLELIRAAATRPDMLLSLEMYDDIAWENLTGLLALKQYKLHQKAEGHLGNSSDDLWRTLGVWLDRPAPADPLGPELWMVTTAIASDGSAAAMLRVGADRRPADAVAVLEKRAEHSKRKATAKARKQFLDLTDAERAVFVSRIFIADGSGDLDTVEDEVANRLRPGAPYEHLDTYLEQVWGWWGRESQRYLQGQRPPIGVQEVLLALDRIRDQFTSDNLPPMVDRAEVDIDKVMTEHADRLYVHQLRRIGVEGRPLTRAVMDYERAYLQATRWVERNLVDYATLEAFSEELLDEWGREFDHMCDKLPADATDDDKQAAGRELLHELGNSTITIRAFREPFFARGQRHGLAEEQKLGWHPDFEDHHAQFLLGA